MSAASNKKEQSVHSELKLRHMKTKQDTLIDASESSVHSYLLFPRCPCTYSWPGRRWSLDQADPESRAWPPAQWAGWCPTSGTCRHWSAVGVHID